MDAVALGGRQELRCEHQGGEAQGHVHVEQPVPVDRVEDGAAEDVPEDRRELRGKHDRGDRPTDPGRSCGLGEDGDHDREHHPAPMPCRTRKPIRLGRSHAEVADLLMISTPAGIEGMFR